MGRGAWSAVAATGLVGVLGLGGWTWFLAGRSLEVMDQWSSVVSSFATLLSLLIAVAALVAAIRSPDGTAGANGGSAGWFGWGGRRSFTAGDVSGSRITMGDNSPIRDKDE